MDFDSITADDLVARGSLKWTAFPGKLGAWIAEMDFGLAPAIADALHALVDAPQFGYLPGHLDRDLRLATAERLATCGWELDPQHVVPGPDVLSVLTFMVERVLEPGARVLVPTPAYMPFLTIPGGGGHEVVEVPMVHGDQGWEYDFDRLDAVFGEGDLLILCNPHNPIGKVCSVEELTRISEIVERHRGWVYNDEIHAPLRYGQARHQHYHPLNEATEAHTITVFAPTKAFNLAGLKCAQAICTSDRLAPTWRPYAQHRPMEVSAPGVVGAIAAYRQGQSWLDEVIAYLDGNRRRLAELVAEELPGVQYRMPDGTYLAWLDCTELGLHETEAGSAHRFFLDAADVALTDGRACGAVGEGCVRLNFATPRPVLEQMVRQMGQAVRSR